MAIIDIRAEPSGRTRMLFDFRAVAPECDDVARIEDAILRSRGGLSRAPAEVSAARANLQAASDRNTNRPVTLPSRRRISAS